MFWHLAHRPHAPDGNSPVLLQQSYGEGPHYGEHRDLPSHNSISSSPFLGAGLVGRCLSAAWRVCGQSRGNLNAEWRVVVGAFALAGVAVPHVGPAPEGVLKEVVKGAAVQRVSSVPDMRDSRRILCTWLFLPALQ